MKKILSFILVITTMLTCSNAFATTVKQTNQVKWVIDQYVDEFGRQTGELIVHNDDLIYGTFSNTAVQNTTLGVFVVADKSDIYLILYEYGRLMVENPLSNQNYYYDVSILDANNKTYTLKGAIAPGDFRLYFDENDIIINAIKSGSITFSITKSGRQANRYSFKIEDTKQFVNLYTRVNR